AELQRQGVTIPERPPPSGAQEGIPELPGGDFWAGGPGQGQARGQPGDEDQDITDGEPARPLDMTHGASSLTAKGSYTGIRQQDQVAIGITPREDGTGTGRGGQNDQACRLRRTRSDPLRPASAHQGGGRPRDGGCFSRRRMRR